MKSADVPTVVLGQNFGIDFPPDIESMRDRGAPFLTEAFRAAGVMSTTNAVKQITEFTEFFGGGMGRKLLLSVAYADPSDTLPERLFVKFPRDFGDPLRDLFAPLMEPEIRFALLSQREDFPVPVPRCMFADYDPQSLTGILITERIAYGKGAIEPAYDKCLDYEMQDVLEHYQALTSTMARLSAAHKAGGLGSSIEEDFPFDPDAPDPGSAILYDVNQLAAKLDILKRFAQEMSCLFPDGLGEADWLNRFADDVMLVLDRQEAIRRYLNYQPDFVTLCHWNMNPDNAWFERGSDGSLTAGLLDWGSVVQQNVGQAYYGMICASETDMLNSHRDELMRQFVVEYAALGGPRLSVEQFARNVRLAIALLGVAWILDAPSLIMSEIPDYRSITGRTDPLLRSNFLARAQQQLLVILLNEWRGMDIGRELRSWDGAAD